MGDAILVINAGSSSIKFVVFVTGTAGALAAALRGTITGIGTAPRFLAKSAEGETLVDRSWGRTDGPNEEVLLKELVTWIELRIEGHRLVAAGHRVVYGGSEFTAPTVVDADVMQALESLTPLAPLHQPHNLAAIRWLGRAHPRLPGDAIADHDRLDGSGLRNRIELAVGAADVHIKRDGVEDGGGECSAANCYGASDAPGCIQSLFQHCNRRTTFRTFDAVTRDG